jgi:hypothetical protein
MGMSSAITSISTTNVVPSNSFRNLDNDGSKAVCILLETIHNNQGN